MSWLKIAIKNLIQDKLRLFFNLLLMSVAVGLLVLLCLVNVQFKNHLERNLGEVDLILGAKGSPLQSVLCNMFHVDAPTGNIELKNVKAFLRKDHPIINKSLALALGDNVNGFRLVGTTLEYFDWYSLSCGQGKLFENRNDAVLGFDAARILSLSIGDGFKSGHGLVKETELNLEHDESFIVKGILAKSNTISDRLVFVPLDAYWHIHGHEFPDSSSIDSKVMINNEALLIGEGQITSLLLRFKGNNIQSLNFGRSINENTDMMAANPPIELNRMYELTGSATDLFSSVAFIVGSLALLALFISLWQALNERKKEFAIMRIGGGNRLQLFYLSFSEALLLSIGGICIGICLAHGLLHIFSTTLSLDTKYGIHAWIWIQEETKIVAFCFILSTIVSVIPIILSARQNILKTLTEV